ncbi:MAG: hypothetical protein Q8L90_11075 [Bacteroidota bacterium]|jgi:hypothetical protein|nr:hypothetical protein [Bacteroidota bacterium]
MSQLITKIFDKSEGYWESKQNSRNLSYILVAVFIISLLIGIGNYFHVFRSFYLLSNIKFTDAIEFSFNFLLFFEMIGLVFVIPQSISNSIAKQFQIMSLIFLRTSFEELSNLSLNSTFQEQFTIIYRMASDAGAALIIFSLTGWFYSLQKHRQITDETERTKFINLKKIIAIGVLIGLLTSVFFDIKRYLATGLFHPSYPLFYLILIFADMLLMLAAFRYVIHYPNIFRYSAFVLITIFIRIALMAPVYYNAIIGISTVLFGIGVAYVHNFFFEGRVKHLIRTDP